MGRTRDEHPVFEANLQVVEQQSPIVIGHGPFLEDFAMAQEEQLARGPGRGESTFGLSDFAQHTMVPFD
jgi:hypothetical protein